MQIKVGSRVALLALDLADAVGINRAAVTNLSFVKAPGLARAGNTVLNLVRASSVTRAILCTRDRLVAIVQGVANTGRLE